MTKQLTLHLMGGLGNQMFQYAAARAIAYRNSADLFIDERTGFVQDKVYSRCYELGNFPIRARTAEFWKRVPFWTEKLKNKLSSGDNILPISNRKCITTIKETTLSFIPEIAEYQMKNNVWMRGYWQSEQYFSSISDIIKKELSPPAPTEKKFLKCEELITSCNSVAVGIRLFEEMPGVSKRDVGGLTPISFFNNAGRNLVKTIKNPVFFVFCTKDSLQLRELSLPGPVHFITSDNGFRDTIATLWLMTRCKNHIIANSSFYWWGAWLSEFDNKGSKIIASPMFPNKDTIPKRWLFTDS